MHVEIKNLGILGGPNELIGEPRGKIIATGQRLPEADRSTDP